jgi:hypothetical protein
MLNGNAPSRGNDGSASASRAASETRLSGWRLIAARTVVFTISAFTIGLGVYALVLSPRLAIPCENALNSCLLYPEQVAPLAHLGITPDGLTLAVVVLTLVAIALANGVAAVLLWRRSDDAMALLVALTLVLMPAFYTPMFLALSGVWRTAGQVIGDLGAVGFGLLLGLFPSGRLVPRWLWLPMLAIVGIRTIPNTAAVTLPIILGAFLCLIGGQIYRYRSVSTPVQRQQTKWAVTGLVLALVLNQLFWQPVGWSPLLQRKDSLYTLLWYPDVVLTIGIVAVTFGVAILRYRLYDIDVIIRRTLVYGTLTAILAAVYFGVVIGTQSVTQRLTGVPGQQPIVTVATTLLIAVLFTPLRRRIQALIDRAFYRSKYDAATTLTSFGAQMRMETDLGELRDHLIAVVQETMQPAHVTLWLRAPSQQPADTAQRD